MTWHCSSIFNGESYECEIENATRMVEAEHAFEQNLWMEYNLTKDVARSWIIVDSENVPCND